MKSAELSLLFLALGAGLAGILAERLWFESTELFALSAAVLAISALAVWEAFRRCA